MRPVRATINDVTLRETDATDKWGGAKASNSSNELGDLMRLAVLESGLPCDFPLVWPSWGMADANECAKLAAQLRALEPVMADLCKPANKAKLRAAVAAHPVYAHQWAARGVTITDKKFVHDMCEYGTTFLLEFQAFIKGFEVGANNGGCAWVFADYEGVSGTPLAPGQPWKPQYPHEPKIYWQNFKDSVPVGSARARALIGALHTSNACTQATGVGGWMMVGHSGRSMRVRNGVSVVMMGGETSKAHPMLTTSTSNA